MSKKKSVAACIECRAYSTKNGIKDRSTLLCGIEKRVFANTTIRSSSTSSNQRIGPLSLSLFSSLKVHKFSAKIYVHSYVMDIDWNGRMRSAAHTHIASKHVICARYQFNYKLCKCQLYVVIKSVKPIIIEQFPYIVSASPLSLSLTLLLYPYLHLRASNLFFFFFSC